MNLTYIWAFTSIVKSDMGHGRQTVAMTKLGDSGELLNTHPGSFYFISEKTQCMHCSLLS